MKKKILLTGATGFLGSHILKSLINEGKEVVILIRESSSLNRINISESFSIFKTDEYFSNIDELFQLYSIDTIIHVATEYGRKTGYSSVLNCNVFLPIRLIELSVEKNLSLFINTDTFFSKFQNYPYLKEYIISKKIFKDYLKTIDKFQVINLQLEHIYGENDSKDKFIPSLIDKLHNKEKFIELTEGTQKRDFIYVKDVVDAYMILLSSKNLLNQYSEFEVGSGISIPIKDFVIDVHKIMNSKSELLFGALPLRKDEIMDSVADLTQLERLGWEPKFSNLTSVKKMVQNLI